MSKIGDWLETPKGGVISGYAFGFGAAVVIVGALFKIMHWPGASVVLIAGMGTEAILFVITAFANPHPTYHWDHVFPQLVESEAQPLGLDNLPGGNAYEHATGTAAQQGFNAAEGTLNITGVPGLSEEDIRNLSEGITRLSKTANDLSKLSDAGIAAEQLAQNMNAANSSLESYTSAQNEINTATSSLIDSYKGIASDLTVAKTASGAYLATLQDVNSSLSSANTAYELQLKAVESANAEIEAYKANAAKLNSQVSSLNEVYGNMLSALA